MTPQHPVRIGTRGSALARVQAELVAAELRRRNPEREFSLVEVSTKGDRERTASLAVIGGTGVFVKEIENALLEGRIDIAVHSLKDMPTAPSPGLVIAAVPMRADPRDALVSRDGLPLDRLPAGATVGTSSSRRAAQVRALRPDLRMTDIRGNVDTRLRKVESGDYDAAVLALAGLARLGIEERAAQIFGTDVMLPSPGQGALAVQVREDDAETLALVSPLDDPATHAAVRAERAVLARLGAGCLLPIGAYAEVQGEVVRLSALIAHPTGEPLIRDQLEGDAGDPEALGARMVDRLLEAGGRALLDTAEARP